MSNLVFVSGAGDALDVRNFSVKEAINKLFRVELTAVSPDPDIDLRSVLGRPASFAVHGRMAAPPFLSQIAQIADLASSILDGSFITQKIDEFVAFVKSAAQRAAADFAGGLAKRLAGDLAGKLAGDLARDLAGKLVDSTLGDLAGKVEKGIHDVLDPIAQSPVGQVIRSIGPTIRQLQSGPLGSLVDQVTQNLPGFAGRMWHGVVTSAEHMDVEPNGLSRYRVILEPQLWLLTQRRRSRIFQALSAPEIAKQVLSEWNIEPETFLDDKAFPKLESRVQYDESDFDFLARLLQEAGISFSFEQALAGDTRLVLADAPPDLERLLGLVDQHVQHFCQSVKP